MENSHSDPVANDRVWAFYAPLISRALEHGGNTHTTDDVRADILAGRLHLIGGSRSVLTIEIVDYPQGRHGRIVHAAVDMGEVLHDLEPKAEAFARAHDAVALEFVGRRGWLRAAAPLGYAETAVVMARGIA